MECWPLIRLVVWCSRETLSLPLMNMFPFSWILRPSDAKQISLNPVDSCFQGEVSFNGNKTFLRGDSFCLFWTRFWVDVFVCFKGVVGACGILVLCDLMRLYHFTQTCRWVCSVELQRGQQNIAVRRKHTFKIYLNLQAIDYFYEKPVSLSNIWWAPIFLRFVFFLASYFLLSGIVKMIVDRGCRWVAALWEGNGEALASFGALWCSCLWWAPGFLLW